MGKTVIVIGAGITGVSCAEELRRAGADVTLVDRVPTGDPSQTSFGNAGILAREGVMPIANPSMLKMIPQIMFSPRSPVYMKWSYMVKLMPWAAGFMLNGTKPKAAQIITGLNTLLYDTVEKHTHLAKGTDAERYISRGDMTFLYRHRRQFTSDRFANKTRAKLGMTWTELNRDDLMDRDPQISQRYQFGLAYHHHGWITNPSAYVAALAHHFQTQGGKIHAGQVTAVGDRTVRMKDGSVLHAETIVLATGAWSKGLASALGHKVPLQGERGYHLTLQNASHMPPNPYLIIDKRFGLTPMDGFLRCAGQSEFAPLDSPPNPAAINNLRRFLYNLYPNLEHDGETTWQGTRPTLPDSLPMIGRSPNDPTVVFAFGAQHLGLTMGPKVGQLVRDIVLDRPSNIDTTAYSPSRFD
jgi:D-amino-acid dehydrogenase